MRIALFTIVVSLSSYALASPGRPTEGGGCDNVRCNAKVCGTLEILPCQDANSVKCVESGNASGYCSDDNSSEWRRGVEIVGRSSP
jgi:hypothetical protein